MSPSKLKDCIIKSGLSIQKLINELTSLRGQADDVFIDDCLKQIIASDNQPNYYPLIEYVREQLNTGHWCDVPDYWRSAYTILRTAAALAELKKSTPDLKLVLWELDDGLIMGHNNQLHSKITHLARLINALISHSTSFPSQFPNPPSPIPTLDSLRAFPTEIISSLSRVNQPSVTDFLQILAKGDPVILTGCMSHWPALDENNKAHFWSLSHWSKRAGNRTVPIEVGSAYTDESWGQRLVTIDTFIKTFILDSSSPKGYLAQHQLFLQIPELGEEVDIPEYCYIGADSDTSTIDSNIWFGPPGTVSPLHHDSDRSNVLCQVIGWKYVRLYRADQTSLIYPHEDAMLSNTTQVNVEDPDLSHYPRFGEARGFHGILAAGEMLFIPPRCWHYLRSLSTSISLNFWWHVEKTYIPDWPKGYGVVKSTNLLPVSSSD